MRFGPLTWNVYRYRISSAFVNAGRRVAGRARNTTPRATTLANTWYRPRNRRVVTAGRPLSLAPPLRQPLKIRASRRRHVVLFQTPAQFSCSFPPHRLARCLRVLPSAVTRLANELFPLPSGPANATTSLSPLGQPNAVLRTMPRWRSTSSRRRPLFRYWIFADGHAAMAEVVEPKPKFVKSVSW